MLIGYNLPEWENHAIKLPIQTDLSKNPHSLITGKSGSGKSQSFLWYTYHLLDTGESMAYIADFKAGREYAPLRGCPSYTSADSAVEMIRKYYELYSLLRVCGGLKIPHMTLSIEEWFGLLGYMESRDKKLKTELMAKVGEILALGRGIGNGIGITILVQRADSSNFSAGSREQFQNICSFGRISREQKGMLFSGEDIDTNRNYKPGQGLALIDGQGEAQEIIVPWIPEQEKMLCAIHSHMDRQPSLQELIDKILAAGGGA